MERSEQINELAAALAKAQGEIEGAMKDSANPFFRSKYADLASVWNAIRGPLSAAGLAVMQPVVVDGSKVTVTTLLAHSSGQWISSQLTLTAMRQAKDGGGWETLDNPQAIGSTITYARRYALSSMAGVAPEDDDGEAAEGRNRAEGQAQSAPKKLFEFMFAFDKKETTGQYGKPVEYWEKFEKAIREGKARKIQRQTKKGLQWGFEIDDVATPENAKEPGPVVAPEVPVALKALFDKIDSGEGGYVTEGFRLGKERLMETLPNGTGEKMYLDILANHGVTPGKKAVKENSKAAILEMYMTCEAAIQARDDSSYHATDEDVPLFSEPEAK